MQVLAARLQAAAEEAADAEASAGRQSQVRTVDRSERIRTYNFPENRITDHRIGFKAHNLDAVLDGDMEALLDALGKADREARLAASSQLPASGHDSGGDAALREHTRLACAVGVDPVQYGRDDTGSGVRDELGAAAGVVSVAMPLAPW